MIVYQFTCPTCGYINKNTTPGLKVLQLCWGKTGVVHGQIIQWCRGKPVYSGQAEEPDLSWMKPAFHPYKNLEDLLDTETQ